MSSKYSLPMILATSLVPGDDESLQQVNVASWKAAGFEVISINGAIEAQALKTAYPDVHIVVTEKTAERIANKPVPYIHDLLKALKVRCESQDIPLDQCIVGIINADIYLRAIPALRTILQEQAQGALILGPRVDVSDGETLKSYVPTGTETYSIGYDYFLMSGDLLDDFAESPFAMGMPFWDYWLPLVTLLHGRPLKSLNSPVALHVHHETRWDDAIYLFFHSLVAYVIELCRKTVGQNQSPAGRQFDFLFDVLSHTYGGVFEQGTAPGEASSTPDATGVATLADFYDRFQDVVVHHIKSRAKTITAPEA
jgi:hypothetical protein